MLKMIRLCLRLAWREIKAARSFSLSFALSLGLGLVGFLVLDTFKSSLDEHLATRSKSVLAADLAASARRPMSTGEQQTIKNALPSGSQVIEELGFFSMVAAHEATRLIEVRAVEAGFPFYGKLQLQKQGTVSGESEKSIVSEPVAWVYPELLVQLGLKIGDPLKIGDAVFTVVDVIEDDPSLSASGMTLAPKIYIGRKFAERTGLLSLGSRIFYKLLIKTPPETPVAELAKQLSDQLKTSDIRVRGHKEASEDLGRLLIQLNDYLGLVALVALFLAGTGAAYLFRSFLSRRYRDVAVLLSLGASINRARFIYITQLVILGLAATAASCIVSYAFLPLLPRVMQGLLPEGLHLTLNGASIGLAAMLGCVGAVLFCLPQLVRLGLLKPAQLFREESTPKLNFSPLEIAAWLPVLAVYWGLAIWQAHSIKIGTLFISMFLGASLIIGGAGILLLKLLELLSRSRHLSLRLALLNLARHKAAMLACFLAISLGTLLVNLVPQIQGVLEGEFQRPEAKNTPSLFLFDIQEEQVTPLTARLQNLGASLLHTSPMVRARLESINGEDAAKLEERQPATRTREDESQGRTLNRSYNLSYRSDLASSEELVSGRAFKERYIYDPQNPDKLAEVSIEHRFADRLGLNLGDKIGFDVQGVMIEGVVVNLRRVHWATFQPNFFVQFQPGALDDAPKTFLAAVPPLTTDLKNSVQLDIVQQFPNISVIDVSSTIARILDIVSQMGVAITFMALLSLLSGFAVLFSIATHQAQKRMRDTTLLKVLGADFPVIRAVTVFEFGILGLSAALLGGLISLGMSYVLSVYLFDKLWNLQVAVPLAIAAAITLLCIVTGVAATMRTLRAKPRWHHW